MKGLILNDLLSIRRMLKTLAGIFLIFMVAWAVGGQPATGAMMLCIMGASYILNLFSYDEFYHWEKYLRVLPVSTKQVVLSRYATFGIMASATAVISLVYLLVLNTPMQEILSVLLMTVVLNVYFAAVMIPVAYKWGVQKGRLIFMLVLGVLSGLFVAGVFILNRQVSVVATASFYKMVLLGIAGLFLLLVLGLLLSIHLSVKIVSKKESKRRTAGTSGKAGRKAAASFRLITPISIQRNSVTGRPTDWSGALSFSAGNRAAVPTGWVLVCRCFVSRRCIKRRRGTG